MSGRSQPAFPLSILSRLRFPYLFLLFGALFVLDLAIPDFLPVIDEVMLGLLTLMMGSWRRDRDARARGTVDKPPEKNVTPPRN